MRAVAQVNALAEAYSRAAAAAASIPAPPVATAVGAPAAATSAAPSAEFVPGVTGVVAYAEGTFRHGGWVTEPPQRYQWGGRVGGWGPQWSVGREIPVLASPGEVILNQQEQAVVRSLVGGQAAQGTGPINITINLTVNGSREDPEVLAQRIGRHIDQQLARRARLGWRE